MRFGQINPDRLSEKELVRLTKGQKVHTKYFGTIRILTEEELRKNPSPKLSKENKGFLPIVWL